MQRSGQFWGQFFLWQMLLTYSLKTRVEPNNCYLTFSWMKLNTYWRDSPWIKSQKGRFFSPVNNNEFFRYFHIFLTQCIFKNVNKWAQICVIIASIIFTSSFQITTEPWFGNLLLGYCINERWELNQWNVHKVVKQSYVILLIENNLVFWWLNR